MRGAPAIAIVGCLSLAVELRAGAGGEDPVSFIRESLCHLTSARPTAVNMGRAARELMEFTENESMEKGGEQLRERYKDTGLMLQCFKLIILWYNSFLASNVFSVMFIYSLFFTSYKRVN